MKATRIRHRSGVLLAALFALMLGTLAGPRAALAQTSAIVVYVEGPDAPVVRGLVLGALPQGIQLADAGEFHAQLVREGQNRPIGKDLDPAVIERARRATRIMGAAAAVVVRVRRERNAHRVLLLIVPAWKTPAVTEETTLTLTSRDQDVATLAPLLGPSLQPYAPESPPPAETRPIANELSESGPHQAQQAPQTPAPQATAVVPPTVPPPEERTAPKVTETIRSTRTAAQTVAASLVDVALMGGAEGRRFDYRNGIDPDARRSTVSLAPAVGVCAQLFPLAHARGPWGDIGFVAAYERIFSEMNGVGSVSADLAPSSSAAGLRVRIHPGSDPRFILGLSVQYAFVARRAVGPPQYELPDVTYRSVRASLDARVSLGRFSLLEEVAFRAPVDTADISTRFYSPAGHGLDAEVGAALLLAPTIEGRIVANYEIDSFAFTPPAGATFGSGSARDQLYGAQLALALVL